MSYSNSTQKLNAHTHTVISIDCIYRKSLWELKLFSVLFAEIVYGLPIVCVAMYKSYFVLWGFSRNSFHVYLWEQAYARELMIIIWFVMILKNDDYNTNEVLSNVFFFALTHTHAHTHIRMCVW